MRGQRYRASTQESKAARAATLASLKLAQVVDGADPLPRKVPVLLEFSRRFPDWLEKSDWTTRQKPVTAMAAFEDDYQ